MKFKFIPVDYDYFDWKGRNYIRVIGRNEKGKRICVIDFCPVYFWVILKENLKDKKINSLIEKIKKIKLDLKGRYTKVECVELHEKQFLGKKVKALKVFATNYKDLHDIASKIGEKEVEKRRGYDLGFISHYIIEKNFLPLHWYEISGEILNNSEDFGGIDSVLDVDVCIKLDSIKNISDNKLEFKPKVLAYDIETDELKLGQGEILMISLVGTDGFKKVITSKKDSDKISKKLDYLEYVEDESELLEKFVEIVRKESPDFLAGYFSDGFDLPYLKARAEKFKVRLSLGLDETQPVFSNGRGNLTGKIKGIVHLDIFRFIKTAYSQYMNSETLSLNDVSKEFLGDTKKDFKFKHSSELDKDNWINFYEYNLQDSILTLGLFNKIWPDLLEFTRIMQEPIFDVSRNGMSKNVESYILHNLKKFNEIPEKRPTYNEISERRNRKKYVGAFVFEPKPGLYENIAMFDFTSYWPSIIVSFNLSKSTFLKKKEKNSIEVEIGGEKTYFSKEIGFFSAMLKEVIELRKKYKQELKSFKGKENTLKKARSNAFKLLANSSYGYQGFFGARYYCPEASAAVTAISRNFIKDIIEKINKKGYKTIYGDTDSIAFLMNNKSEKEVLKFLKELNLKFPGVMALELEDFYKRGIWVTTRAGTTGAKKKYALIDKKGKLKIRGFETVRRDWCKLARKVQSEIIGKILNEGQEKKSLEYVKKVIKKIKKREIEKEDLIIKTQLKKSLSEYKAISPHVIAARKMKEQKIPVSQGSLVEYYISEVPPGKKVKLVREKVKLPNEPGEYNISYYLKNQILPAVENIFQVFGINIKEIIEGKKQMTLGDF